MENFWKSERILGDVELAIWRAGEGDPLILIHGITAQHRTFNDLAKNLAGEYELIGIDLRGRGDSDKPESGYGLDAHAGDVVRVLDHLGLEDAVLVGHSMGAFVSLQVALSYPGRVRSLVLLDGGWPRQKTTEDEMTEEQKKEAEVEAEVSKYEKAYKLYTRIKPGMSGVWQVSGRSDTGYDERVLLRTQLVDLAGHRAPGPHCDDCRARQRSLLSDGPATAVRVPDSGLPWVCPTFLAQGRTTESSAGASVSDLCSMLGLLPSVGAWVTTGVGA